MANMLGLRVHDGEGEVFLGSRVGQRMGCSLMLEAQMPLTGWP